MASGFYDSMGSFGQLVVPFWLLFILVAAHGHDLGGYSKWRGGRHANGTIICPEEPPFYDCSTLEDWVCGSDGLTYKSECHLDEAFCNGKDVKKLHEGACQAPPCGTPCPKYHLPICVRIDWVGRVTVANPCELEQAKACNGTDVILEGRKECECVPFCPLLSEPSCGSDGRDYELCELQFEMKCRPGLHQVGGFGYCKRAKCNAACDDDEDQLYCGTDDTEYGSLCELERASSCQEDQNKTAIYVKNKGECLPVWPPAQVSRPDMLPLLPEKWTKPAGDGADEDDCPNE